MEVSATVGFQLAGAGSGASSKATLEQQAEFKAGLAGHGAWLHSLFPNREIVIWAEDEARLGLQPIVRRVWAPIGERPSAHHCRRYQWVYTYGFVHPEGL
jgi:hypothetical protein